MSMYRPFRALFLMIVSAMLGICAAFVPSTLAQTPQGFVQQFPGFPVRLAGDQVRFGSPTVADITNDGRPEIIVGGKDGIIHAVSGTGRVLWQFRTDVAFSAVAKNRSATTIRSAPVVADLTGDGKPEIAVSVGEIIEARQNGGVVVLKADGTLLPGWPQLTMDRAGGGSDQHSSDGYADGVIASPTIADFTGDGVPEVAYGATDQNVYLKGADGRDLPGWPHFVRDTIWSSPAAADLDGNGTNELITGIDAHYNDFFGDLDGGYIKVYRGDGSELPGWPQHQEDVVYSSPAVTDLDGDGRLEVVIGSGGYYGRGRDVTAYRADGQIFWVAPTDGPVSASPALGDINGDKQIDVVVVGDDRKVYAWNGKTGSRLAGYPVTPTSIFGTLDATGGLSLADYDGDGANDIFVATGGFVSVLRGNDGVQLTSTTNPPGDRPVYDVGFVFINTPALADLNGDGKLELIGAAANGNTAQGQVSAWSLPNSSGVASWPMFRRDPAHTALIAPPAPPPTPTPPPFNGRFHAYLPFVRR